MSLEPRADFDIITRDNVNVNVSITDYLDMIYDIL